MLHKNKPSQKQLITGIIHEATAAPDGTLIVQAVAQTHMPALFYQQEFTIHQKYKSEALDKWLKNGPLDPFSKAYKQYNRTYADMKYKGNSFELKNNPNKISPEKLKAIDYCFTNDKWLNKPNTYNHCYTRRIPNLFAI